MRVFLIGLWMSVFLFTGLLSSRTGTTPGGEYPSLFVKGARFYWVTTADLDGDGRVEIIAGGQIGPKKSYRGYIGVYREENSGLVQVAEDTFSVIYEGKSLPTRIRAVVAAADPVSGRWEFYAAGRSGEDETGAGFLRKSVYTGNEGEKAFDEIETLVFRSSGSRYTHGYPIALLEPDGEKRPRVVYGGFSSGGPGTKGADADRADVRVFRTGIDDNFRTDVSRPFDGLAIPLRVNALATGDIDGDGKEDIVIAGRTKTDNGEKAAFACWCDGKIHYNIMEKEDESRFRTLLIADLDSDGKMEILTGGRIDVGKVLIARLECWRFEGGSFRMVSRYAWTGDRSTRLRDFVRHPGKAVFYALGRSELLNGGELEWNGFVRSFRFENNRLMPAGDLRYVKNDWETRIRHAVFFGKDRLLLAGFCANREKKEKAFLQILKRD